MGAIYKKEIQPQSDATGLALAQTLSGGGLQNFTLNGGLTVDGVFTAINAAHRIDLTSVGNDSGIQFIVSGTDNRGVIIQETITGGNAGTVSTENFFSLVTEIQATGDTAGDVTIGVNGNCVSEWILTNIEKTPTNIGLFITLSDGGVLTYDMQHTPSKVFNADVTEFNVFTHDVLNNQTASQDGNYAFPGTAYRLFVSAFTSGSIEFESDQAY